jgi:hypothetical protein
VNDQNEHGKKEVPCNNKKIGVYFKKKGEVHYYHHHVVAIIKLEAMSKELIRPPSP